MGYADITRDSVLKALAECDERGGKEFLDRYGFRPARRYRLIHDGRAYDSKAIVGVAYLYAQGRALRPDEFSGGTATVVRVLRELGFQVSNDEG